MKINIDKIPFAIKYYYKGSLDSGGSSDTFIIEDIKAVKKELNNIDIHWNKVYPDNIFKTERNILRQFKKLNGHNR